MVQCRSGAEEAEAMAMEAQPQAERRWADAEPMAAEPKAWAMELRPAERGSARGPARGPEPVRARSRESAPYRVAGSKARRGGKARLDWGSVPHRWRS